MAVTAAVALAPQASADDSPSLEPDVVTSMNLNLIYVATATVPPLDDPGELDFPEFEGFGLVDLFDPNIGMAAGQPPDVAAQIASDALLGLGFASYRLKEAFPGSEVEMGTTDDPLFANWKAEGGSATVESPGGQSSSTSPAEGVQYNVELKPNGTVAADFTAKATVAGEPIDIGGAYVFQTDTMGQTAGSGHMAIECYLETFDPGTGLRLSGSASVAGYQGYNVSLGASTFTIGMTGNSKGGPNVSVAAPSGTRAGQSG